MAKSLRTRIDEAGKAVHPKGCCGTCGLAHDAVSEFIYVCPDSPNEAEYVPDRPNVKRCVACGKFPIIVSWYPPTKVEAFRDNANESVQMTTG